MSALRQRLRTVEDDCDRVSALLEDPQGQRVERVNLFEAVHTGGWITAIRIIYEGLVVLSLQAPQDLEHIMPMVRTLVPVILPQLPADSLYPENESGFGELRIVLGND